MRQRAVSELDSRRDWVRVAVQAEREARVRDAIAFVCGREE
jgi:hypothetical protein